MMASAETSAGGGPPREVTSKCTVSASRLRTVPQSFSSTATNSAFTVSTTAARSRTSCRSLTEDLPLDPSGQRRSGRELPWPSMRRLDVSPILLLLLHELPDSVLDRADTLR